METQRGEISAQEKCVNRPLGYKQAVSGHLFVPYFQAQGHQYLQELPNCQPQELSMYSSENELSHGLLYQL